MNSEPPPPVSFTISSEFSFGRRPLAMPRAVVSHGLARGEIYFLGKGVINGVDPDFPKFGAQSNLWPITLTVHLPDGDYRFQFDEPK